LRSPQEFMTEYLAESTLVLQTFAADPAYRATMATMAEAIGIALQGGGKLLIAGNGGSAADAQHIAGEFLSRLMFDRAPLAAIALTTDTSVLTAAANDFGFDTVFERQVLALGRPGDVFLAISTSGRSRNVLLALDAARARGVVTMGFCGGQIEAMARRSDLLLAAPSERTAIIQQIHIVAAHIICALVERAMFPVPPAAG